MNIPHISYQWTDKARFIRTVPETRINNYIRFMGRQDHKTMLYSMENCDIFILPSYNEAFGIVYLEVQARGCTLVGVRTQGCEYINKNGECIFLADPRDVSSIRHVVTKITEDLYVRLRFKATG